MPQRRIGESKNQSSLRQDGTSWIFKVFVWCILLTILVHQQLFSKEFHFRDDSEALIAVIDEKDSPLDLKTLDENATTAAIASVATDPIQKNGNVVEANQDDPRDGFETLWSRKTPSNSTELHPTILPKQPFGKQWKKTVRKGLNQQEKVRGRGTKANSEKRAIITADFKRMKDRLNNLNVVRWVDDPFYWHSVSQSNYQETLQKAKLSMDEMVGMVYTDCILWLVPTEGLSAMDIEVDDRNTSIANKNPLGGPVLRFQCGQNKTLQEQPCDFANLCLVRHDKEAWYNYYVNEDHPSSRYNHTDLFEKRMPRKDETDVEASSILTMVDSIEYLRGVKASTGKKGKKYEYFIWEAFLNKASYALQTNRDFYIWIGAFETDRILHQRNTETVSRTFGAQCAPESSSKNVVHYYKPIAFATFFRHKENTIQPAPEDSPPFRDKEHRVWFVDADIFFNREAFPLLLAMDEQHTVLSLDDYFDLSPQAALFGSQNPSGKDDNILINGGLLGLRSRPNSRIDWVHDFSALWWYCRCGERDQIALWLVLFATWSAESSLTSSLQPPFSYPGVIFENYLFAWFGTFPHAHNFLPELQKVWTRDTVLSDSATTTGDGPYSWSTTPTNTTLFNGGDGFVKSSLWGMYTHPLELPHVLLLPLDPFTIPSSTNNTAHSSGNRKEVRERTDFTVGLVRKYQSEKKALLTHNKNLRNACYDFQCWPFLIREDPSNLVPKNLTAIADYGQSGHNGTVL